MKKFSALNRELNEGRPSQRHPLEGHEYHKKSNDALVHIAKDAHKAAEAMKSHNTDAENKYRDQANDSATVRHFRQKSGMPDWYKKKYGHMKEENDTNEKEEMVQSQLHFIKYACEEILEYIDDGGEVEEWYQVKVAKSFSEFESLHAFIEGESRRTGMKEEVETPPIHVRSMYTKQYAKHGGTISKAKEASAKAYDAVEKMHGKEMRDKLQAFHRRNEMSEEFEQLDEISAETKTSYTQKATKEVEQLKPHAQKGEYKDIAKNLIARRQKGIAMAKEEKFHMKLDDLVHKTFGHSPKEKMAKEEKETAPFEGGKPKKGTVTDKSGAKHGSMSRVRDIARQALKKQSEKLKTVKESLDESRKAEIVKDAVKSAKDKKAKDTEKFQSEPILSSEIMKEPK